MKYSMREIKQSLSAEKNKDDSYWAQFVVRKISWPFTYILVNAGMSAWTASMLSIVIAVISCTLLCFDSEVLRWIGVIGIEMWLVMDAVDGNIARVRKTASPMGEFIDAESGYFMSAFVYFSLGMAAYFTSSFLPEEWRFLWIVFGAVASISNILPRLIHQKYIAVVLNADMEQKDFMKKTERKKGALQFIRRRIGKELGLSGLFMPLLIFGQIFKIYDWICVFYLLFSFAALAGTTLMYSIKAKPRSVV